VSERERFAHPSLLDLHSCRTQSVTLDQSAATAVRNDFNLFHSREIWRPKLNQFHSDWHCGAVVDDAYNECEV
jgi:hypothetical protein